MSEPQRSPYDGMVSFTTEQALRWALDYIADGSDETPPHECEFITNPPKGACDFHERYWAAREALDYLRATPDLETFRKALNRFQFAHGEWACTKWDHPEADRNALADAAVQAENEVVELFAAVRGAALPPESQ